MMEQSKGIAGHEGAGEVVAVNPDVQHLWKIGDRAGVKWVASVCRDCEFCTYVVVGTLVERGLTVPLVRNGSDELQCPKQLNSGFSTPGTFQEYCLSDAQYTTRCVRRSSSLALCN